MPFKDTKLTIGITLYGCINCSGNQGSPAGFLAASVVPLSITSPAQSQRHSRFTGLSITIGAMVSAAIFYGSIYKKVGCAGRIGL